jgi:hypothetical protein
MGACSWHFQIKMNLSAVILSLPLMRNIEISADIHGLIPHPVVIFD